MTVPRILVSASRLQMGGGLNVLRGLVDEVFPQLPAEFVVVCREDVAHSLNANRKNITLLTENSSVGGFLFRSALREQMAVRKLAKKHKCDLILVIGSAAVLFPPCPQVVIVLNRLYLTEEYWKRVAELSYVCSLLIRAKGFFLRCSLHHCRLLLTESQSVKSLICRKWGLSPNRVQVLHKGINRALVAQTRGQTEEADRPLVILCVSHFAVHKGFETLVEAAVDLERMGLNFSIWVAGDFDGRRWADGIQLKAKRSFDALLEASGVKHRFRFLGGLTPAEVADAYRQADMCVFPSWCESYPNPLAESLANGIPIVAADTDINRELAGDAALYFRPEDPSELTGRIVFLLGSPAARSSLSERAADRARGFSWRRTVDDLWEVLRRTLAQDKATPAVSTCDEFQ